MKNVEKQLSHLILQVVEFPIESRAKSVEEMEYHSCMMTSQQNELITKHKADN